MRMPTRLKVKEGDRVVYEGQPARVLAVGRSKLEIRDVYGFVKEVKKSDCEPYRE
jgi:hypothetical protein